MSSKITKSASSVVQIPIEQVSVIKAKFMYVRCTGQV